MTDFLWRICILVVPAITYAYAVGPEIQVRGCPGNLVVGTDAGQSAASVEWPEPKFLDSDQQRVVPIRSHSPGDKFFLGETTVRYTAYVMGSKATCFFKVTVQDNEPPVIEGCPQRVFVVADPGQRFASTVMWDPPRAADNIRLVEFRSRPPMGARFLLGVTKVLYWALDPRGNRAECTFNVIVEDREKPTFHQCPGNIITSVDPTQTQQNVKWAEPDARDNSDIARISSTHRSGAMFPLGTTSVMYTAEDFWGNVGTCSFSVILRVRMPDKQIFIRNYTTSSLELAWPETEDVKASSYLIYVWPVGESEPPASSHLYQAINRHEGFASRRVGSLLPGTEYNVKVAVSGTDKILRTTQATEPMPPGRVSIKPGTLTPVAFTLLWKPGKGSASRYAVSVHRTLDNYAVLQTTVGQETTHLEVSGLEPDTMYETSICALSGYSDDATKSENVTIFATTEPMQTSGILVQEITSDTITIMGNLLPLDEQGDEEDDDDDDDDLDPQHHSMPSDHASILFIYSDKTDLFTDVIFLRDVWSYTFPRLKPATSYTIRAVNNHNGIAFEANATTRPAAVTDLHISAITHSTATVHWSHAIGPRDRYEITFRPTPKHMQKSLPIMTSKNVFTFTGLTEGKTYTMSIKTITGKLQSNVQTLQITPGEDQAIAMYKLKEKSCLSPLIACGFLGSALLLCVLSFLAVFIVSKNIPAKLRNRRTSENEYENPSHHQYSSYLNSLNNRIAHMRRPESNTYNFPPLIRCSRTFSRQLGRARSHGTLQRTQSESVIYYNLSD
ncbi:uncharacterized protein [Diadema antillarum]|uniref:uncharacterized protein n=1 Tax=Diadema antillarum TaxID=105358 RepID=UPI003A868C13